MLLWHDGMQDVVHPNYFPMRGEGPLVVTCEARSNRRSAWHLLVSLRAGLPYIVLGVLALWEGAG